MELKQPFGTDENMYIPIKRTELYHNSIIMKSGRMFTSLQTHTHTPTFIGCFEALCI